jgi:dihydroceramidase
MILSGLYFLRVFHITRRAIRPTPPAVSRLIRLTAVSMLTAITVWLIDYNLCVYINGVSPESVLKWNPQFHAWWHLLSAYGVYSQSVLIMYYHYDMREMKPEVVMWKGFVPAVRLTSSKAGKKLN